MLDFLQVIEGAIWNSPEEKAAGRKSHQERDDEIDQHDCFNMIVTLGPSVCSSTNDGPDLERFLRSGRLREPTVHGSLSTRLRTSYSPTVVCGFEIQSSSFALSFVKDFRVFTKRLVEMTRAAEFISFVRNPQIVFGLLSGHQGFCFRPIRRPTPGRVFVFGSSRTVFTCSGIQELLSMQGNRGQRRGSGHNTRCTSGVRAQVVGERRHCRSRSSPCSWCEKYSWRRGRV